MLALIITILLFALLFAWKAFQSNVRYQQYKEEHERYKECYSAYVELKEKLDRITTRPRSSNGKFVRK